MSRSIAKILTNVIYAGTGLLSKRQRNRTISRIISNLMGSSTAKIKTPTGELKFHQLKGSYTASAVERFYADEPETLEWIDNFKEGETLWDVGANIGLYSLYAAQTKNSTVYAFEPSAFNFGLMVEHIHLNKLGNKVYPLCIALGNETSIEMLHMRNIDTGHAGNALGAEEDQFGKFQALFSQAIPAFTIDDFIALFRLNPPDHLKIDVDGIEYKIIEGAMDTLQKVKSLLIEIEGNNLKDVKVKLEEPLSSLGFTEQQDIRKKGSCRNRLFVRASGH